MVNFRNMNARALAGLLLWTTCVLANDWAGYRGDGERRAYSSEAFPEGLKRAWTLSVRAPTPAWPQPAPKSYWQQLDKITARVTDDSRGRRVCFVRFECG